jgi:hypothetical protein
MLSPLRRGVLVSYRERPDIYGPELNGPDPKAMRWAAVAIIIPNLGPLLVGALKHYGFHASREVLTIGVVLLGAMCLIGAVIAYREARRSVERHIADLAGDLPPERAGQ